ncbi:hypothetical protein VIBNISOn1_1280071 [Vibrio nigripulchritudo SOn1]|uniref:DUF2846 domain-containing protein n=1 Tax=Vibrio nigripulchritudo SOn1 TaxID=1238450 RepID=A0AAV2VJT2_9VIBR|nr:hypothetical protein [Vibrio nigripulchritudo]CCO44922.1 hypothetical protein VIBNISOn1_1280071 [Vibrio nigripulchritudo SOn1]
MRKLFFIALALSLAACASSDWKDYEPPAYKNDSHGALVAYYQCSERGVVGAGVNVYVDGEFKAHLNQGTYYAASLPAGSYTLSFKKEFQSIDFNVEVKPTTNTYYRVKLPLLSNGEMIIPINKVDESIAQKILPACKWAKNGEFSNIDAK